MAVVELGVVRLARAAGLDGVEDGALQAGLVPLDEQEVVRFPAAVFLLSGDVCRGLALGVGGVGGDDRAGQVHGVQQLLDLGDLIGVVGDAVLGDDHLLLVQHRGEQLDLPVADAAQPFAVDRDRGQQARPAARRPPGRAASPPVSSSSASASIVLEQGADPRLARGDDPPPQRMRPPAEPGQHVLRQVGGLVADLPEVLRPGQHARDGDRQHEHQRVPAAPPPARVRDLRQHLQQAGHLAHRCWS